MSKVPESEAERERAAALSGNRLAGYCGVERLQGGASCHRPPGHYPATRHLSYYLGKELGEFD